MAEFLIVRGVCRPETPEALEIYKGIQREINRAYDAQGKKLIRVGGRIGDDTRKGVNALLSTSYKTCSEVANRAASIWGSLKRLMDERQLPIVADPAWGIADIFDPPSKFDPDTNKVINPDWKTAGVGGIPFWAMLLISGGGYYYLYGGGKKKTRKSLTR